MTIVVYSYLYVHVHNNSQTIGTNKIITIDLMKKPVGAGSDTYEEGFMKDILCLSYRNYWKPNFLCLLYGDHP